MEDVKALIQVTWSVLGLGWVALIMAGGVLGYRVGWRRVMEVTAASARGTIWLMIFLALGLVVAFGVLFVGFHRVFFEGDTWLFAYSDTFIRLYPERFWRDTFALVAIVTLLLSGLLRWLPRKLFKPTK
jgi:integral membrane protein (TIGR01906 family)